LAIAFFMGLINPLSSSHELNILYNYAGGIEEGSPVRVMGIKVGRVKKIEFDPSLKSINGEEVKLKLLISIEDKAWSSVRKDSKFFINLAGVIGEKFLEISPGSSTAETFENGDNVRGEDPPRVDQLISQSYGLAGKIIEIVEKNEGTATNLITQMDKMLTNLNKTLLLLEQTSKNKEMSRLLSNTVQISDDLAYLTHELRSKNAEETYSMVRKLLFRLEDVDGPQIKKFFQQEGVRARIF
jgi:phospholipid/cholesterol/gamma-HCH transport system substrate-binding protein